MASRECMVSASSGILGRRAGEGVALIDRPSRSWLEEE
jgi:hypothetical protein